jgi:hypothetical protein
MTYRIPGQIAEQLRGQVFNSFNNFDDFREAFWKAVASDPDLASGFSPSNVTRMVSGRTPFVLSGQSLVREAVKEFLRTGGCIPTCVEWKTSDSW